MLIKKVKILSILLVFVLTAGVVMAVEKPDSPQKTCLTEQCHTDYGKKAFVHGPVELGDCKSCHDSKNAAEHTFEFTRGGRDLCEFCHLDQTIGKNVHEPVKTGDCTQCHDLTAVIPRHY